MIFFGKRLIPIQHEGRSPRIVQLRKLENSDGEGTPIVNYNVINLDNPEIMKYLLLDEDSTIKMAIEVNKEYLNYFYASFGINAADEHSITNSRSHIAC